MLSPTCTGLLLFLVFVRMNKVTRKLRAMNNRTRFTHSKITLIQTFFKNFQYLSVHLKLQNLIHYHLRQSMRTCQHSHAKLEYSIESIYFYCIFYIGNVSFLQKVMKIGAKFLKLCEVKYTPGNYSQKN